MAIKQPDDHSYFILPDLGEGVHEAELIKWHVATGESVDEHQTLAEMETDKALVEVPSPWAGVIRELHGNPGDILNVGNPLVSYDVGNAAAAPVASAASAASEKTTSSGEREDSGTVVGTMSGELTVPSAFARRSAEPVASANGPKALATPAVRRLARELGANIDHVGGTGRGGRVTASDVHEFVNGGGVTVSPGPARTRPAAPAPAAAGAPSSPSISTDGTSERIPFRGVRRTIAQALEQSVRTAVHFTVVDEADVTELDRKRREYSSVLGRKLSFLPFLMSAVCQALRTHKTLNAIVDDANSEILLKGVVNLGCAVDTDHGLMVPVIEGADRLSVVELGDRVKELALACRNRTIPRERLVGGTFTISNVGSYGGMFATPIINYPEVAILAAGRATERVLVRNGQFYPGTILPLSLSCDHRVVDGAEGTRFLNTVRRLLEAPEEMLLASSAGWYEMTLLNPTVEIPPAADRLRQRLEARTATIAIVGMGYVGLPLARAVHESGFSVIGFDVDDTKIDMLQRGESYLHHLGDDLATTLAASKRFTATARVEDLGDADVILLCVPTPLGKHREPDLSYVLGSTKQIAGVLRPGQLVVLESTTYPGTTRGEMLPILEKTGLRCGEDFFVAYSPEREDPGRPGESTASIPKLVGGIDGLSTDLAMIFYEACIASVHRVESAEVAEAAKLLENIYRAVNIAMVNEMKVILSEMDIDVWEVIKAASTKPFGFQPFYPGPGLGGHCIPIDPFYLTWKAKEIGRTTKFIELAGEINAMMPRHVVSRTVMALSDLGRAMNGARVLVLGIAYKPDVDDVRESPAAEIIDILHERGANVSYHDPHVPQFPHMRKHDIHLESVPLTPETLIGIDCVLIVTDHANVDYALVGEHARLIVDTRNAMAGVENPRATIVKA